MTLEVVAGNLVHRCVRDVGKTLAQAFCLCLSAADEEFVAGK